MRIRFFARRCQAAGLLLCLMIALGGSAAPCAAREKFDKIAPPRQLWLSLGFSTLDETPVAWDYLRAKLAGGRLWRELKLAKGTRAALVVPVLDDGRAFFETQVAPFAGRNASAAGDEALLQQLLREAKGRRVPVYLAFNCLGWQKMPMQGWKSGETGIFDAAPEWEELLPNGETPAVSTRFASPWSPRVQGALSQLIGEAARRFPLAAGALLDVHLSRGEILGFSAPARIAARREIGLDPTSLTILGTADEKLAPDAQKWVAWRVASLRDLGAKLSEAWRQNAPRGGEIWLAGEANYGKVAGFDALRSAQNFAAWTGPTRAEGLWLESPSSGALTQPFAALGLRVVPVLRADSLPKASIAEAGIELGATTESEVLAFAAGRAVAARPAALKIGEIAPDVTFSTGAGDWNLGSEWNHNALIMVGVDRSSNAARYAQELQKVAAQSQWRGVVLAVVSPALPSQTVAANDSPVVKRLFDARREWLGQFSKSSLVVIDRAGWVRAIENLPSPSRLAARIAEIGDPTPVFAEGKMAPDFSVIDMNGQKRRLSDLKGKKSLLLTFFPKCFTGGCTNHLTSLDAFKTDFEKLGVEILAVSIDSAPVQRDFARRWNLSFALVPDEMRQLSLLFGAVSERNELAARQTVFIDRDGIVRFIDRNVNVQTHGADVMARLRLPQQNQTNR